jgi:hypothetical protein
MKKKSDNKSKASLIPLIKAVSKMDHSELSHTIDCLNDETIDGICECVYNVIFTDLNLTAKKKTSLKSILKKLVAQKKLKKFLLRLILYLKDVNY